MQSSVCHIHRLWDLRHEYLWLTITLPTISNKGPVLVPVLWKNGINGVCVCAQKVVVWKGMIMVVILHAEPIETSLRIHVVLEDIQQKVIGKKDYND